MTHDILAAAIEVHRRLGPGLLEAAYEACLGQEFAHREIPFERQVPVPVLYRDTYVECGYRLDFVVDECVVVR
jgi:GxxExxY protein